MIVREQNDPRHERMKLFVSETGEGGTKAGTWNDSVCTSHIESFETLYRDIAQ